MRYKKALLILLVLLLLPFTLKLRGEEFGQNQSLFTDIKAHKVGDILTVLIYEQNRASQKVEAKTEKNVQVFDQRRAGNRYSRFSSPVWCWWQQQGDS